MRILILAVFSIAAWAQSEQTQQRWEAQMAEASNAWRAAQYDKAEKLYAECLRVAEGCLDKFSVAVVRNNLGALYHHQARYVEAEQMYREALPQYEKLVGLARVSYAALLSNLGETLRMRGDLDGAERLYRKALLLAEETDRKGGTLATTIQNFALLLNQRGKAAEGRKLGMRALALQRKLHGEDDWRQAQVLNTIGEAEWVLGLYEESAAHHQQALDLRLKGMPVDHPEVATGWANLGSSRQLQGRYEEAEECYRQAIAIREGRLGNRHPTLAPAHINLGTLYIERGELLKAENEIRLALSLLEGAGLTQTSDYGKGLENLAALFLREEKYSGAEKLFLQALAIREKVYGVGSPQLGELYMSLAKFYDALGRKTEAGRYQKRAEGLVRSFQ